MVIGRHAVAWLLLATRPRHGSDFALIERLIHGEKLTSNLSLRWCMLGSPRRGVSLVRAMDYGGRGFKNSCKSRGQERNEGRRITEEFSARAQQCQAVGIPFRYDIVRDSPEPQVSSMYE